MAKAENSTFYKEKDMSQIAGSLMVIAIMVYGLMIMVGGLFGNPGVANEPYRWLLRSIRNTLRRLIRRIVRRLSRFARWILRGTLRLAGRILLALVVALGRGYVWVYRHYPSATVIITSTIVFLAIAFALMAYAGLL